MSPTDATTPMHVAGSIPYAWPYDGRLDAARLVLLICGAQRAVVAASVDHEGVADRLGALAEAVRSIGGTVVWVRHGGRGAPARPTASLPARTTPAWELVADPPGSDEIVDASGWDGCFGSDLDHRLRVLAGGGWCTVLIGGYASEITVDSTVRTLNDRGHECLVLVDGCAPLDVELGARAHASVTMSGGIFGALGSCASTAQLVATLRPALQTSTTTPAPSNLEVPA